MSGVPFAFWGLFVVLLLILVGYALWMWGTERRGGADDQ